jgi:integrase/recombinase XerC
MHSEHIEPPCGQSSFRHALGDFRVHLQASGRSAATLESYSRSLRLLEQCIPGVQKLEDISADLLEMAVVRMSAPPEPNGKRPPQGPSPQRSEVTLNRHRSTFKAFFRWAMDTGRISRNPAVQLRLARVDSPSTMPITVPETRALLAAIRRSNDPLRLRDEALFGTYALTGLRRMEALQLDVSDYDDTNGLLRVKNGKGRQSRLVPVVDSLALLLGEFRRDSAYWQRRDQIKLFPGRVRGHCLTARQANARFELWRSVAGLRGELTIHSFRAGFATTLHHEAGDLVMVSRALGHRDLRQTLRYVECCAKVLPAAIKRGFAGVFSL